MAKVAEKTETATKTIDAPSSTTITKTNDAPSASSSTTKSKIADTTNLKTEHPDVFYVRTRAPKDVTDPKAALADATVAAKEASNFTDKVGKTTRVVSFTRNMVDATTGIATAWHIMVMNARFKPIIESAMNAATKKNAKSAERIPIFEIKPMILTPEIDYPTVNQSNSALVVDVPKWMTMMQAQKRLTAILETFSPSRLLSKKQYVLSFPGSDFKTKNGSHTGKCVITCLLKENVTINQRLPPGTTVAAWHLPFVRALLDGCPWNIEPPKPIDHIDFNKEVLIYCKWLSLFDE